MAIYVGMTRRLWDPLPGGGWIDNKKIASFNKMLTNPFHMNNLDVTFTLSRAIETTILNHMIFDNNILTNLTDEEILLLLKSVENRFAFYLYATTHNIKYHFDLTDKNEIKVLEQDFNTKTWHWINSIKQNSKEYDNFSLTYKQLVRVKKLQQLV